MNLYAVYHNALDGSGNVEVVSVHANKEDAFSVAAQNDDSIPRLFCVREIRIDHEILADAVHDARDGTGAMRNLVAPRVCLYCGARTVDTNYCDPGCESNHVLGRKPGTEVSWRKAAKR